MQMPCSGSSCSIMIMIMKHKCQNSHQTEHRSNKKFVISLHPMKFELAGTIEWESNQWSHHCYGAVISEYNARRIVSETSCENIYQLQNHTEQHYSGTTQHFPRPTNQSTDVQGYQKSFNISTVVKNNKYYSQL